MNKIYFFLFITFFSFLVHPGTRGYCHEGGEHTHEKAAPVLFVPNEGQWEHPFRFKGLHKNADIFLEQTGITYRIGDKENSKKMHDWKFGKIKSGELLFHHYNMTWKNANPDATIVAAQKQPYYHNYFLGQDPKRWKSNVSLYGVVMYQNIYDNIDVKYYTENEQLKYDFIVRPQGNPSRIVMQFNGTDGISLDQGQLVIKTSVGNVIEMAPYSYQVINGEKKTVPAQYEVKDNEVRFVFPKGYNKQYDLIIDPVMVFASLSGSTADNWGFTATYDPQGNLYAGGIANGLGYPTTSGAYRAFFSGGSSALMPCDITISKFNSTGSSLIYSTYIGGTSDDYPHSLIVDNNNNLIIAGKTLSQDYPVTNGAFQTTFGGGVTDLFVTKLNASGSALVASTFLGGTGDDGINVSLGFNANQNSLKYNYGDDSRSEVIVDNSGNIYVVASTQSSNFPTTTNGAKRNLSGLQDGIFTKFNPALSQLIYSTLIGGSNTDAAYVITMDKQQQNIYIAGGTQSTDFHPGTMSGSINTSNSGGLSDGFIVKFQNSGNYTLLKSTYIGTSGYDQCYGVQVDGNGNVYVMGQTTGAYPVVNAPFSNPNSAQFIHKLNNTFTSTYYSTVFGNGSRTTANISLVAMLVDTCENVYVSGWGGNAITPGTTTSGLPVTQDALQPNTDGSDFYFIVIAKDAQSLLYGSFFGAFNRGEHVDGGTSRFDPHGVIYQAMCASCGGGTAFPSTPGAYSSVNGSPNCNIGVVKIAFGFTKVVAQATPAPSNSGCAPFTVNFNNSSVNATQYRWDFGHNGATSTQANPSYTYPTAGTYTVRLIAHNPGACVEWDTTYLQIQVRNDSIRGDFSYTREDTCYSFDVNFTNLTTLTSQLNPNQAIYRWDFGDNTTFVGRNPPTHTYPGYDTYTITLTIEHPLACNNPVVISKNLTIINNLVSVDLPPVELACINDPVFFNPTYVNARNYTWDFGDGSFSNDATPSHIYTTPGSYTITLVANNPSTCNINDTASIKVNVYDKPTALFSYTPITPEPNKGTQFLNQSEGGDIFHWDFNDGRTSSEKDPYHEFYNSGTFKVCLTVKNEAGCEDVTCKNIQAIVHNLADVPTGFSPNGDGTNDKVYVKGYNIETIDFKIYNRFGNLVFSTRDKNEGWDGTYNGVPQEMDAFGYTLEVTFRDGTSATKKGNITLIR